MVWQVDYLPVEIAHYAPAACDGGRITASQGNPPVCANAAWSAAAPPLRAGAASTTAAVVAPLCCKQYGTFYQVSFSRGIQITTYYICTTLVAQIFHIVHHKHTSFTCHRQRTYVR